MKVQVSMEGILRTSVKNNQAQIFEINNSDPCYMEKILAVEFYKIK